MKYPKYILQRCPSLLYAYIIYILTKQLHSESEDYIALIRDSIMRTCLIVLSNGVKINENRYAIRYRGGGACPIYDFNLEYTEIKLHSRIPP